MADERKVAWGLWNATLGEWFNPGTSKPYYPTREAAQRMIPLAMREYPMGKWEVRPYPLEDEATGLVPTESVTTAQAEQAEAGAA
jgi:hypothetical protein